MPGTSFALCLTRAFRLFERAAQLHPTENRSVLSTRQNGKHGCRVTVPTYRSKNCSSRSFQYAAENWKSNVRGSRLPGICKVTVAFQCPAIVSSDWPL